MTNHWNRRAFLRACQAGAIAAIAGPRLICASEPVKRNGTAKFKFSLAAYSYRKLLTGKEPELTFSILSTIAPRCSSKELSSRLTISRIQ